MIVQSNPGLELVNLGKNRFTGSIPEHLCELLSLQLLDLSNNKFPGILPKCLGNLIQLYVMDLSNNTMMGDVPNSLGSVSYLQSLHLQNNKFEGNLPVALQNLTSLVTFDLGNNMLTGNIPSWFGKKLSNLNILNLRSNKFMGKIPLELCQNNALQHLNLANNSIIGMIPRCFYNLTGMINTSVTFEDNPTGYEENIEAYIKGIQLKYTKTLRFLISIDLSSNKIIGEIPDALMNLASLTNLNLSRNLLSGHIPTSIGNLKSMESLDFSMNELSGRIPPSLASLNFLSYLNLSFSKLSGPIPDGNQLQTLGDPSAIYEGNNELCGPTLSRRCEGKNLSHTHVGDGEDEDLWLYTSIGLGFVVGFMGLIGSLYFKKEWRIAYFESIENVYRKCLHMACGITSSDSRTNKEESFLVSCLYKEEKRCWQWRRATQTHRVTDYMCKQTPNTYNLDKNKKAIRKQYQQNHPLVMIGDEKSLENAGNHHAPITHIRNENGGPEIQKRTN
ncbi:disease resistance family protein / LRR family protein [Artemisia annua]|uniref:Disease resistance family protein / LRR family protein n=1 Tax=Artemisia annua TaxID=35608 RepID=A0A2U1PS54_ARTAN|nr:disease resistance family protein / LRR family protein [Artemisia annua]